MPAISRNYWFLGLCLLLSACSGYEKVLKSNDVNYKLTKANEYFDNKKYQRASELYESLIPVMKNTRNYEPLYYRYAYTFYYMKDYLSASYHFKNFVDFFPNSANAEECEYLYAVCLYKQSPPASQDQTNTIKAMGAFQAYINSHPASTRVTEANTYVDAARRKLEEKAAGIAKLYYNIGQYRAASITYKNVMLEYPESAASDYYQYMLVRSTYHYARNSDVTKQEERYNSALEAFGQMKESYPNSQYLREAEKLQLQASNHIKKLRK